MPFEVATPTIAVANSEWRFPVHRIYCVGRNYAEHVREMGNDPSREPPVFFLKPTDTIVESGASVKYPPRTSDLHHEIELVVALGKGGTDITADEAEECVFGYAAGVDLTRRDLQADAKQHGRPWDSAKSFEDCAPISTIHKVEDIGHPRRGRIWLAVNGDVRQDGDLAQMIWSVAESIAELSTLFTLAAGDLVYTGTPAGVGAVGPGDAVSGGIEGIDELKFDIV
jgi:fumarylpyruvate hydrolase